jgi:hypothetical protein
VTVPALKYLILADLLLKVRLPDVGARVLGPISQVDGVWANGADKMDGTAGVGDCLPGDLDGLLKRID